MMRRPIEVVLTVDRTPPAGVNVIVAGGQAVFDGRRWFSTNHGADLGREIQWPVRWWAHYPLDSRVLGRFMCPHCGWCDDRLKGDLVRRHTYPPTSEAQCPGVGQVPRNPDTDRRRLWKDGGEP